MHFGRPYSLRTRKLAKKTAYGFVYGFVPDLGEKAYGLLRICTGFGGGGLRIVYGFGPDLGEEACGLFLDLDRIWGRRLTDCLRIFSGCGGRGLRIVYGFLPDVEDEAYGLLTDLYRIWGRRLADCLWIWTGFGGGGFADCLWIWTGFGGEGLRIVYGFVPDLGEEACGLFMDLDRIWGRRLADCLWIWTGFGGEGLRIVYGFFPDVEDEAYGLFTDFYRMWDEAYGLFTDLYRIWGRRLADCLWIGRIWGRGLRIPYGFVLSGWRFLYGFLPVSLRTPGVEKSFWLAQVKKIIHRKKMWKKCGVNAGNADSRWCVCRSWLNLWSLSWFTAGLCRGLEPSFSRGENVLSFNHDLTVLPHYSHS